MSARAIPAPRACVGTKRGKNYGLVYDSAGTIIGRVFRDSKVARGTGGKVRRSFWTANAILDGVETTASLGTRHERRCDAVNAILAFHASYPADTIRVASMHASRARFETNWKGRLRSALSAAAAQFKYDNPSICGLSVRNLSDPRKSRWHIHVPQEV